MARPEGGEEGVFLTLSAGLSYCALICFIKIHRQGRPGPEAIESQNVIFRARKNFKIFYLAKLKMEERDNKAKYSP